MRLLSDEGGATVSEVLGGSSDVFMQPCEGVRGVEVPKRLHGVGGGGWSGLSSGSLASLAEEAPIPGLGVTCLECSGMLRCRGGSV